MRVGDVASDGQAEAGTAAVPAAGAVEPGEALEDAFAVRDGDAGPVVGDDELGRGLVPEYLDPYRVPGVSAGVVEQVGHQPVQERGHRVDDDRGPRPGGPQPDVRASDRLGQVGAGHGGKVDRLPPSVCRLRDSCEQQKVSGDRFEPLDAAKRRVEEPGQIGLAGMQPGLLELGPEPGEGGVEFVSGVGGEPAPDQVLFSGQGRLVCVQVHSFGRFRPPESPARSNRAGPGHLRGFAEAGSRRAGPRPAAAAYRPPAVRPVRRSGVPASRLSPFSCTHRGSTRRRLATTGSLPAVR